jgi:rubrerythrin
MNELAGVIVLVILIALFGVLAAGTRSATDIRATRRWEARFDSEVRAVRPTDATGVLRCRRCGASGSERAGRCPSCGAVL